MEQAILESVETKNGRRVFRARLSEVANNYELEGFRSTEEFVERCERLHPERGFRPDDMVWVHEFEPDYDAIIERFGGYIKGDGAPL
jgi:hypothetical protein